MQELGRAYGFIFNLSESEKYFVMAMDRSLKESNCRVAREVQVDLMQALALNKECKKSIEWGKRDLFEGCKPDYYSVNLELAHCYEAVGSIDQAIHLYESMLNETPENSRIHFLLSSIKKRQKERQLK